MELGINDTFIGISRDFDNEEEEISEDEDEPVAVIVFRVIFALLISLSWIVNLLLVVALIRQQRRGVIYSLIAAMIMPDILLHTRLAAEMMGWVPWSDATCSLWQWIVHWTPLAYAVLILAVVYHALIALYMDHTGSYEASARKYFILILGGILLPTLFLTAPSAMYAKRSTSLDFYNGDGTTEFKDFRQHCDLSVPALVISESTEATQSEAMAAYRLVYEIVLPYVLPLVFLGFPYVCLMVGLMRNVTATSNATYATKMSVVLTLWLVTLYMMLHMASVFNAIFSVFNVWERLVNLLNAHDDARVPKFRSFLYLTSQAFTCVWCCLRPALCFKYNGRLRKALT